MRKRLSVSFVFAFLATAFLTGHAAGQAAVTLNERAGCDSVRRRS
jgi:hypothetical protein